MELKEDQKEREDREGQDNEEEMKVLDFKLIGLELLPRRAQTPGLLHRLRFTSPSTRDQPLQRQLVLPGAACIPQVN